MKTEYRNMRLRQLSSSLAPFELARSQTRPSRGWLQAIREALGLTLDHVGKAAKVTRQRIQRYEIAEAEDRITLATLRRVAVAIDCELVYAIVPKSGSLIELAEKRARDQATRRVLAAEHTMALENQAAGNIEQAINDETQRILMQSKSGR
jgi:predicted DNA-binding mobile mystery protein A